MTEVSLNNIRSMNADGFSYYHVSNAELAHLGMKPFLKFTYIDIISKQRQTACVAYEKITHITYFPESPELKTQAEVLQAYKEGRLVGY